MTPRRRQLLGLAALLLLQTAIVAMCIRSGSDRELGEFPVSFEPRSEPAPDIVVEDRDGARIPLGARTPRFQLVHFWATWCPPCRVELPALLEQGRRHADQLTVWAVAVDPDWETVERFLARPATRPVVRDPGGAARAYGVTVLPDTYLVDPGGRIVARFAGARNWRAEEMDRLLAGLLAGR